MTTLEKIKAEIAQLQDEWFKETDGWWCYEKALQIIDKYAEQEPCDAAIDREYLFKVLDDFCGHDRTATITLDTLADLVYDMPPVTKKPIECDDVVSRQYLIDIATKDGAYDYVSAQEIANAPSVRPQPCDDAISRQAVLDALVDADNWAEEFDSIKALPSVKPQEQTKEEHIDVFEVVNAPWMFLDNCANSGYYCSKCKKKLVKDGWSETVKKINFCPNCGARMFEPQESEEPTGMSDAVLEHYKKLAEHYNGGAHEPIQDTDARD